ncbi:MAG: hypothetical protein AAGD32_18390 [Planctomycetota bacterium]
MALLNALFQRTLNSVRFGIFIMACLGVYIAVGSGIPEVREFFEMNEMEFFNWWPMPLMAFLLIANLTFVTFNRIPFTPPRYGVWMIHAGIVILTLGLMAYFSQKVEGLTMIRQGQPPKQYFYDAFERALYVRAGSRSAEPVPLPDLPRFDESPDYVGDKLMPAIRSYDPEQRAGVPTPIHESLGLDEPVTLQVVGYYPYAAVDPQYTIGHDDGDTALKVTHRHHDHGPEGHVEGEPEPEADITWMVASRPGADQMLLHDIEFRHIDRIDLEPDQLLRAAEDTHRFRITVDGQTEEFGLVPGGSAEAFGYAFVAERFWPRWTAIDGSTTDAFSLRVTTPDGQTFRRMVLDGRDVQTDFVIGAEGAGPMGARQPEPLDVGLDINYRFLDGLRLWPRIGKMLQRAQRETFLTTPVGGIHRLTTFSDAPPELQTYDDVLQMGDITMERFDGVRRTDRIVIVPPEQRERDAGRAGAFQVVQVRVASGDFETTVVVPFMQFVYEYGWTGPVVDIPGASQPIRIQMGNYARPMPVAVALEKFEAVPYPGGIAQAGFTMRDFRSTLDIVQPATGEITEGVASMNSPVYVRDESIPLIGQSWLLYQASWNPEDQTYTVLGVGNRPGVYTMIIGSVLMFIGLMWAFYLKPVLIRRAKQAALAKHAAGRKPTAVPDMVPA